MKNLNFHHYVIVLIIFFFIFPICKTYKKLNRSAFSLFGLQFIQLHPTCGCACPPPRVSRVSSNNFLHSYINFLLLYYYAMVNYIKKLKMSVKKYIFGSKQPHPSINCCFEFPLLSSLLSWAKLGFSLLSLPSLRSHQAGNMVQAQRLFSFLLSAQRFPHPPPPFFFFFLVAKSRYKAT